MKDFKELKVWQKAHRLILMLYRVTGIFPREELYGLTSQMRGCRASIAANIAEGCGRKGNAELHRFLEIAAASELDYLLLLARDLHYLDESEWRESAGWLLQVRRMLTSLARRVNLERSLAKC